MDIRKCVVSAQGGSTTAFGRLVEKHYGMVYALAFSHVRNRSAAQDVAQEVFLVAWSNLARLKHPESFLMWLRRITRNCALNWLRTETYRGRLAANLRKCTYTPESASAPQIATLEKEENAAKVSEALSRLSPKLREALLMFYFEGKSVKEAAKSLGVHHETMKKRLYMARTKLREDWEKQEKALFDEEVNAAPSDGRNRVLMGLGIGSAAPEFGKRVSGAGIRLWLHDLMHGGSPKLADVLRLSFAEASPILLGSFIVVATLGVGVSWYSAGPAAQGNTLSGYGPEMRQGYSYEGIGIFATEAHIEPYGQCAVVDLIFQGTPAERAGLRVGDLITTVDGMPFVSLDPLIARDNLIAGPAGTEVVITVLRRDSERSGRPRRLKLRMIRAQFQVPW